MRISLLLLASIVLPMLVSCGSSDPQVASEGGIGGTGVTQGKVSGYGSIFVNGVEFHTDNAVFVIEEEEKDAFTQDDIKLGMVVKITSDTETYPEAIKVEYSDLLDGSITSAPVLDANGVGTLQVMYQTVHVERTTIFDVATGQVLSITDLAPGDIVEVSGFSDGRGTIYATRVEFKALAGDMELKGIVENLNASTFTIGELTVDYSQADSLPDGAPQEGWYVEVSGTDLLTSKVFLATSVEMEDDGDLLVADDDDEVELEGVVTSTLSGITFTLNGQSVSIENLTIDTTQIIEGRELKAEGSMVNGVLIASAIEFVASDEELQEIFSRVEEVTTEVDSLNSGTITLLGRSITVTSSTIMEDESEDGDDQTFNLNEVIAGADYIQVDVYDDGNDLVAVKLEREDPQSTEFHEIEGVVEEVNVGNDPNRILILGIQIDITATGAQPAIGDRVEVSGNQFDGTVLTAQTLEIEDED